MSSVPNRTYQMNEYNSIHCLDLNATTLKATNLTGSNIVLTTGILAQGAIVKYQPVVFTTNATTTTTYLSGATADLQTGIVGVAAEAAADGETVNILHRGTVASGTYTASGANVTLGGLVGNCFSGSTLNRLKVATAINTVVGYAILTGAGANVTPITVYVFPH